MEFYDFPFSWECHHPNWRTHSIIFQRIPQQQPPPSGWCLISSAVLLSMYPTGVRMINIQPRIKALIINGQLFPNHDEHINCKGLTNHVSGISKELACWVSRIFLVGRLPLPFHADAESVLRDNPKKGDHLWSWQNIAGLHDFLWNKIHLRPYHSFMLGPYQE